MVRAYVYSSKKSWWRICVDLSVLNESIDREYFPTASDDYILSQFCNAKVFSIIDANAGFWYVSLDADSAKLTSFTIPSEDLRSSVCYFGIKMVPSVFQKIIHEIVKEGLV